MPNLKIHAEDWESYQKVEEIFEQTRILKRQLELDVGRWSFVVFGPKGPEHTVVREGCAIHLKIDDSLIYIAAVGDPDKVGERGMPIEEFAQEKLPPELNGLEIFQIDPVRPLNIYEKWTGPHPSEAVESILENFKDKNTAVIETPDERYWSLSVLKYLNECDRFFPDILTEALKKGEFPFQENFSPLSAKIH